MKQQLEEIKSRAAAALANAKLPQEIDELRVRFLGKKGELTGILKQMGKLSPEERPVIGQLANAVRADMERKLEERKAAVHAAALEARLAAEAVDVTRQTIISLESGRYNASLLLAHRIARYFGLTIEEVFLFEEGEA